MGGADGLVLDRGGGTGRGGLDRLDGLVRRTLQAGCGFPGRTGHGGGGRHPYPLRRVLFCYFLRPLGGPPPASHPPPSEKSSTAGGFPAACAGSWPGGAETLSPAAETLSAAANTVSPTA